MRNLRRILSALLVVCMVFTMFPATVTAADSAEPSGKRIVLEKEKFASVGTVWVDGVEYPVIKGTSACYVDLPEDANPGTMVAHTYYVGDASDVHTQYPNSMKVWALQKSGSETYSAQRMYGLDNSLIYSGMSIRITGNKGIRMITSMEQSTKSQLVNGNVDGYRLMEYGTVIAWASSLKGGKPLVLNQSYTKHNYAYKRDVADPVFNVDGSKMQYTNVLVGFTMEQCASDLCMRPYMILEDGSGKQVTLYGGTLTRSIGYIAWQNRYVFAKGTDSYNYVWEIIRSVYGDVSEVRFNSNGGSNVEAMVVENGKPMAKPADPVKSGFEFAGWYTDSGLTAAFDFTKPITDNITLYAKWETGAVDADGDGVPSDIEELLGITEGSEDSDGDGISDYVEIYELGSDPKVADSDQDHDNDGLSNYNEIHVHKTDPVKKDTDMDGLTDGEEVNTYGSNPLVADTDGDRIEDGNEILLGTGLKESNNIETITQRVTEDVIDEKLFNDNDAMPEITGTASDVLNDIVSVKEATSEAVRDNRSVIGKGLEIDLKKKADLTLSFDVPDTSKTLGIMRLEEEGGWTFQDTKINSDIIWTDISEGGTYCVMDLDVLLPLIGVDVHNIYAEVTGTGASEAAVEDLYGAVEETKPAETEVVETEPAETEAVETEPAETEAVETEPAETEAVETEPVETEAVETEPVETEAVETEPVETEVVETEPAQPEAVETEPVNPENSGSGIVMMDDAVLEQLMNDTVIVTGTEVMGQADIVFAIDTTGSMSDEISNVANNIAIFVQRLTTEYHVNANFALVDYRDITCDGIDSTKIVKNGSSNWYTKPADYASVISRLRVSGGGDGPETAVDALDVSRRVDFRSSAKKFVILVTDANYKVNNNYGISSMEEEINLLKSQGIITSVVTSSSYKGTYQSLYETTGGIYANIYGNFAEELLKLADLIGEEVNESNWILLDTYEHIALDAPLSPTSGDTDKDGVSDYDELKAPVKKDFTDLLRYWLYMNGISQEMIDDYFLSKDGVYITMYPFKSNPVLPDTDFDGMTDKYDTAPQNNSFSGTMLTEHCDSHVGYTFDYTSFFKDNTVYYPELSVTSLLFTTYMYCDAGFDFDKPVKTNDAVTVDRTQDIRELMKVHGFQDIMIYDLDDDPDSRNTNSGVSMVGYSDDDVTEAAIGHRKVTYKGVTKDIVGVFVRGTNGTIEEWSSNFDIGNLSMFSYYDEWTDNTNHKGFDITANRMLSKLYDYTGKYVTGAPVYWLTGHSRGAAIINIMGAKLVDAGSEVFAYGFATPNTTINTEAGADRYDCIFSLVNDDDFVPRVPMTLWNFKKYGKTAVVDMTGAMENEWHDLTGRKVYNQMSESNMDKLVGSLAVASDGWSDCYVYHCSCHGDGARTDTTEMIGIGAYIEIPWRVLRYSQTGEGSDWLGRYPVCQTPAYLLAALGDLSYKQNIVSQIGKVIDTYQFADRYENARTQLILSKTVGGISQPHYCATYYLLTQYAQNSNFR